MRLTSLCLVVAAFFISVSANAYMTAYPTSGQITQTAAGHGYNAIDIHHDDPVRVDSCHRGTASIGPWDGDGWGNYIRLAHHSGYISYYCHLQSWTVVAGREYYVGDQVGVMGSTGMSTGRHLHFEIRKDTVKQVIPGALYSFVTRGADMKDYPGI